MTDSSKLDRLIEDVADIKKRLFVDNGTPSIQTRLDRHDTAISAIKWLAATAGGAAITAIVAIIFKAG